MRKSFESLSAEFYWSPMKAEMAHFVKRCHTCQVVGQPNQPPPKSPLSPIPVTHPPPPFSRLIIDNVGPLPTTYTGSQFVLTIMDPVTRYPVAFPLSFCHCQICVQCSVSFFLNSGCLRRYRVTGEVISVLIYSSKCWQNWVLSM